MKDKLIKLSFPTKEDWEEVKESLQTKEGYVDGIKDVFELGHLQKPPSEDWQPDPETPDDNGWGFYEDWAVDMICDKSFNYDSLAQYMIKIIKGNMLHSVAGGKFDIIYDKIPNTTWGNADLKAYLDYNNIKYGVEDSKKTLLQKIDDSLTMNNE